jgi:four helix bundle protein
MLYNQHMPIRNYQDLVAWQKAVDLVVSVYAVTRLWPSTEKFGLISQVQRAAVSVPSNIAEGQGRRKDREFHHHLSIAHGSLREVETQLVIAQRLGYIPAEKLQELLVESSEVGRLITGLMHALETS